MGTFGGAEEISAGQREDIVIIYIQRIDRLQKITAVQVPRQHTTFTLCQNAAFSNDFFL